MGLIIFDIINIGIRVLISVTYTYSQGLRNRYYKYYYLEYYVYIVPYKLCIYFVYNISLQRTF